MGAFGKWYSAASTLSIQIIHMFLFIKIELFTTPYFLSPEQGIKSFGEI